MRNMNTVKNHIPISFLLLLPTFFSLITILQAKDSLGVNQVIRDNETIISPAGSFELGFFSPGKSTNRYVGIWYKKISVKTVVWVANRENPLTNNSGILKVADTGNLILLNDSDTVIWSTNFSNSQQHTVAKLLDTGNLVVKDANNITLWESFSLPTDTLLPGMRLGKNFKTGKEVFLSSWKTEDDPGIGEFTYHCDPTGYPQLVFKQGERKLASTGPWNGVGFSGAPNVRRNSYYQFGLVMNKNEVYYHYELLDNTVISRFMVNTSGKAERSTWVDDTKGWGTYLFVPGDMCDSYGVCGQHGVCDIQDSPSCGCLDRFVPEDPIGWNRTNWEKGCIRRRSLNCSNGDVFLKYSGLKLPDTTFSWYNESLTLQECKDYCFKNCTCTAYTKQNISGKGNGCLVWFGELVDIRKLSTGGQEIYIRMAASELDSNRLKTVIRVILALVAGILIIIMCVILYLSSKNKSVSNGSKQRLDCLPARNEECSENELELPLFDMLTIAKATDHFSYVNKIGEGGFGPVYKGILEEGKEIAVKRLSRNSHQGVDEFKNEAICIAKLHHRNLVKLLGCCIRGPEKMLIYEYMVNRSLDLMLFDKESSRLLDWPKRFQIINGIARGLMYLHQDSCLRIIHRDLKASNILLDCNMNPKISDFGMARIFGGNETGANTNRVVGTYGYMSPEYAIDGEFSVKSDVYSFGVLVLEIVSSKKNRGFYHGDHQLNLLGHAWMLYNEEREMALMDSNIEDSSSYSSEILQSIRVGLLCVQQYPNDRPTMASVIQMLGYEGLLPQPKQPGFFTGRDTWKHETSFSSNTFSSANEMSITILESR